MGRAKKAATTQLLYELGELARERMERLPSPPMEHERVVEAEREIVRLEHQIEILERQMNAHDASYRAFLERQKVLRAELEPLIDRWRLAVDAVKARARGFEKELAARRSEIRRHTEMLAFLEERWREVQMTSPHDAKRLAELKDAVVRLRIKLLRLKSDLEERSAALGTFLTPSPGQPGAPGILAYKRLLEMESAAANRKESHDAKMHELDARIAACEQKLAEAQREYDEAILALGQTCHASRVADPAFAAVMAQLDRQR